MDDLQFRRNIYANPNSQDDDMLFAQKADANKMQFAQEIRQLDDKITNALNVPVPDGLYNKLILRQTMASHQQEKRKKRFHLALAASVAIMAGAVLSYFQFSSTYTNLGDYALAHVYHEKDDFSNDDETNISLASLNKKMATFDGSFTKSLGKIIAADYCRFDGMNSLHLVFQGKFNPVSVFIVPKKEHLSFTARFSDNQLSGESLGFNNANVIVVTDKNESIDQWKSALKKSISWTI